MIAATTFLTLLTLCAAQADPLEGSPASTRSWELESDTRLVLSAVDLARLSSLAFRVPRVAKAEVGANLCSAEPAGGSTEVTFPLLGTGACAALADLQAATTITFTTTTDEEEIEAILELTAPSEAGSREVARHEAPALPAVAADAAFSVGERWHPAALSATGELQPGSTSAQRAFDDWRMERDQQDELIVRFTLDGGGEAELRFARRSSDPYEHATEPEGFCTLPEGIGPAVLVCFDSEGRGLRGTVAGVWEWDPKTGGVRRAETSLYGVIPPNLPVVVQAWHLRLETATLDASGTAGLLEVGDIFNPQSAASRAAGPPTDFGDQPMVSEWRLAPRTAENVVTLTVTVAEGGSSDVQRESKVELLVERRYVGAIRMGLGLGFTPYAVRYGVTEDVVTARREGLAYPSVVLGYVPTPFHPRSYVQGPSYRPLRVGAYLGVGLVTATGAKPGLLDTVHLGLDMELRRSFSVVLSGFLMRMDALDETLRVGSYTSQSGADIVHDVMRPGVGIIVNVSPRFFAIAKAGVL